ncbi:MAG: amidohydrolase family protein, partial [bacterium]
MDLVIRKATIAGKEGPHDIGIRGAHIASITPSIKERGQVEIDAAGNLVTPALVETHIHLDAALTVGQPRHNRTGSLFEGIEIWSERVRTLTHEDVRQRATTALKWLLAHGVTYVRTHVD